jgi:hypothetical protein
VKEADVKKLLLVTLVLVFLMTSWLSSATGQRNQGIRVSPNGVNVNANGATVVLLTFGPLNNQVPSEGCWCGELISAAPDLGFKCDPATIFGCLPQRFDFSTPSGNSGFTDVMTIPNSVARRAYQAAQEGATSSFFYVRRFINTRGGRDEYVSVTCRMGSGGARTPFALTDVKLAFATAKPVLIVNPGDQMPAIKAEITYNGTGRLKGRWEVVKPGDELPDTRDLLTEATLPIEERGKQQRYTQISTFNYLLPPTGKFTLHGPDTSRLPNDVAGSYLVLLRIEATDDKEGDANLTAVGVGPGLVHNGAVAGFPLPPLRYYVGGGPGAQPASELALLWPIESGAPSADRPVEFAWTEFVQAAFYRLEIEDAQGRAVLSALMPSGTRTYRAPAWLKDRAGDGNLRWRVMALNQTGNPIGETPWRVLRLTRLD